MPWTARDATAKTKKASSPKKKALWARVANNLLKHTGDEGRAIREANAVVSRAKKA